jgi:hypothetical protein
VFFREFAALGANYFTLSFIILIVLSLWQTYAYVKQAAEIWEAESALSVNLTFSIGVFFILCAFAWYGLTYAKSLVITISGLTVIPAFFIMTGAWKYGKVTGIDRTVLAIGFVSLSTFATPIDPKVIFLGFALAVTLPLVVQIQELYKTGVRGVLRGLLLVTFVVKNFFYTVFAYTLPDGEPVLMYAAPFWFGLSVWLLWKWYVCSTEQPPLQNT